MKKKPRSRVANFKPVNREKKNSDVQQLSYTKDFLGCAAHSHKKL